MLDTSIDQIETHVGDFERVYLWRHNVAEADSEHKDRQKKGFIFSLIMEPEPTFETLGCLPKLLFENVQNL
jgi:hypothetical protein